MNKTENQKEKIGVFWFRRDLRLNDNAGLYYALKEQNQVLPIFIFDSNILEELPKNDSRVSFIHDQIQLIKQELEGYGSSMHIFHGKPLDIWQEILETYHVTSVYANHDYEPYALTRDKSIADFLAKKNITFKTYKDHVIFEKDEILKDDGQPYTVFTPYKNKWLRVLESRKSMDGKYFYLEPYPTLTNTKSLVRTAEIMAPSLESLGFRSSENIIPSKTVNQKLIHDYAKTRNFPSIQGTSRLGIHFRFGTISIREKALKALGLSDTFLNELIWRDFYSMILFHFPHVATEAFKKDYDRIEWRNNKEEFKAWKEGKTGYPLVDAGMRELNASGFMHNRVRMLTASFLTKHLLIDWRWGEAYFAEKLLDFDLASNNGGWQWAAGCGTDAAPYFRIFSPDAQQEKFDKNLEYIKKWVFEYGTNDYPKPIVDHKEARERCLATYKKALGK